MCFKRIQVVQKSFKRFQGVRNVFERVVGGVQDVPYGFVGFGGNKNGSKHFFLHLVWFQGLKKV